MLMETDKKGFKACEENDTITWRTPVLRQVIKLTRATQVHMAGVGGLVNKETKIY